MPEDVKPVAKPEVQEHKPRAIPASALNKPGYMISEWSIILPEEYPFEDCLLPASWAHVASQFDARFHHFITVLNDQHTFHARLYVRAVQPNQMIVHVIDPPQNFGPTNVEAIGALKPQWNVGKRGFDVVRVSDGMTVQDGSRFAVKEQALAWIADHLKQMAA